MNKFLSIGQELPLAGMVPLRSNPGLAYAFSNKFQNEKIKLLKNILDINKILSMLPKKVKCDSKLSAIKWSLYCEKRKLFLKLTPKEISVNLLIERRIIMEVGKCQKCKTINNLSIDHIIPLSKNGMHIHENIAVLCIKCNSKKGNK